MASTFSTRRIAVCGLMTALAIILDAYLKIPVNLFGAYALKISLGIVPAVYLSVRYHPVYGGFCGAATDIVQVMLVPMGAYNPCFTLSMLLMGAIPGLFFLKERRMDKLKLAAGVALGQLLCSVGLNTVFLHYFFTLPWGIVWARLLTQLFVIPAAVLIVLLIFKAESVATRNAGQLR